MRCPPTQGTQGSHCSVTSQQDGVVPRRKLEMLMPSRQPTIVLVHGAFANTSTWSKLIPLLIAKGFSVVAVHCPLSSLADDVAAVERVIGMQDAPVLLVGHSWGGAIITEAGNDAKVRQRSGLWRWKLRRFDPAGVPRPLRPGSGVRRDRPAPRYPRSLCPGRPPRRS